MKFVIVVSLLGVEIWFGAVFFNFFISVSHFGITVLPSQFSIFKLLSTSAPETSLYTLATHCPLSPTTAVMPTTTESGIDSTHSRPRSTWSFARTSQWFTNTSYWFTTHTLSQSILTDSTHIESRGADYWWPWGVRTMFAVVSWVIDTHLGFVDIGWALFTIFHRLSVYLTPIGQATLLTLWFYKWI